MSHNSQVVINTQKKEVIFSQDKGNIV